MQAIFNIFVKLIESNEYDHFIVWRNRSWLLETEFNLDFFISNTCDWVSNIAIVSFSCVELDREEVIEVPKENLGFFAVVLI